MTPAVLQTIRLTGLLPDGFADLRREAADEGYSFLDRLAEEFSCGDYATSADLPVLLAIISNGDLAAVGGLTADPYDPAPDLARLRHVYVRASSRGCGIGAVLATALIQQGFAIGARLSLRAADERAARFWESQGFLRDDGGQTRTHILSR